MEDPNKRIVGMAYSDHHGVEREILPTPAGLRTGFLRVSDPQGGGMTENLPYVLSRLRDLPDDLVELRELMSDVRGLQSRLEEAARGALSGEGGLAAEEMRTARDAIASIPLPRPGAPAPSRAR